MFHIKHRKENNEFVVVSKIKIVHILNAVLGLSV